MKRLLLVLMTVASVSSAWAAESLSEQQLAVRNLERALEMNDSIFDRMFSSPELYFYYDMETKQRRDLVSVWEFTAAIEAVNSVLEGLVALKDEAPGLYDRYYGANVTRLNRLVNGLDYYKGTFTLVSYTGPNRWSPYGVHRSGTKGTAAVAGIENVYDDQMWIIRELIRAYQLTGTRLFFTRAEELTAYVLDGWDCTLDPNGEEYGGITWGPGYTSKHACSNSPLISPLVWLHEIYKENKQPATAKTSVDYYVLNADGERVAVTKDKVDYYLDFAKKIYAWQRKHIIDESKGVYYDGLWSVTGDITTRTVNGVEYRNHVQSNAKPQGTYHTYNTGTMISGAADLYRATGDEYYLTELQTTANKAATFFNRRFMGEDNVRYTTMLVAEVAGNPSKNGNPWFNQVLFRGFLASAPYYTNVKSYMASYQAALDYGFDHFLWHGFLPVNLIEGWQDKDTKSCSVQYTFSRVSEYALLVDYYKSLTGVKAVEDEKKTNDATLNVYTLDGRKMKGHVAKDASLAGLAKGLYLVGGQKVAIR